jgi:hypothetical protein
LRARLDDLRVEETLAGLVRDGLVERDRGRVQLGGASSA